MILACAFFTCLYLSRCYLLSMENEIEILHTDHGLHPEHIALVREHAHQQIHMRPGGGLFATVITIPAGVAPAKCALYGPACGDPPVEEEIVYYRVRGDRAGPSRMVEKMVRRARGLAIVGVVNPLTKEVKVYTAYGTNAAEVTPREWWDPTMKPKEAEAAAKFWKDHALAAQVYKSIDQVWWPR